MEDYEFECCICHRKIVGKYSNNPFPVVNAGECCDECNVRVVLPARYKHFRKLRNDTDRVASI